MLSFATRQELLMMIFGHVCATITGLATPVFFYLIGDVLDCYNPSVSQEERMNRISKITV